MTDRVTAHARFALVSLLLAVAACVGGGEASAGPPDLPAHRGRIVVVCDWSHAAPDDPLVHPDEPGASHLHEFFGNTAVDAGSTVASVEDADTSCETAADRAAYWVPSLLDADGDRIAPEALEAYYRAGPGVTPSEVEPYPHGLAMIAGEARSRRPQPTGIVGWSCADNPTRHETLPDCAGDLRLRVTFPDCWDGEDGAVAPDHRAHMAYSGTGGCPTDHPVPVPQPEIVVRYPHSGDASGIRLASGDPVTAHADFWNLWEPDALAREVRACIHGDVVCGDARR